MRRLVSAALIALAVTASCSDASEPAPPDDRPLIVATTSILGDVVRGAFGGSVAVETLIPAALDPHSFRPSPQHAARLREASLVVANGLGLEGAFLDVLSSARDDGVSVLFVGDLIDSPRRGDAFGDTGAGTSDPHFWLDPRLMAQVLEHLGDELARVAPDRAGTWRDAAASYGVSLLELDAEIRELLSPIPQASRKLITNHDALGYFADAYGFTIVGTVIPGGTTVAEPSASDLADLVEIIRREQISAIFADTTRPARLAEVVAQETGRPIEVVELYTGSLGEPGSGADTYPGYLITNATLIAQALVP